MKIPRRTFLRLATGAAALPAVSRSALGQNYPSRPVLIIVPFPPGGGTDYFARLIGQSLAERLGQPFVVENRPGANGNIGTEAVLRASPDGYTLLLAFSSNAINATFYDRLNYDFIRDIVPISGIVRLPELMLINPTLPAKTVPDFVAYAKGNPGKINMASAGIGSPSHMAGELFKMMAGIDMLHVPYHGSSPALTDLLGGQVQFLITNADTTVEHVRSGKLRALAITTTTRSEALPDVPTVDEYLPGYEASVFYGIGAPRKTSAEIVDKLNREINAIISDAKMKARLVAMDGRVLGGTASEFGRIIADETEKWAKVIKFAGIKAHPGSP